MPIELFHFLTVICLGFKKCHEILVKYNLKIVLFLNFQFDFKQYPFYWFQICCFHNYFLSQNSFILQCYFQYHALEKYNLEIFFFFKLSVWFSQLFTSLVPSLLHHNQHFSHHYLFHRIDKFFNVIFSIIPCRNKILRYFAFEIVSFILPTIYSGSWFAVSLINIFSSLISLTELISAPMLLSVSYLG